MRKIWLTADWHLDHKNIISLCNRPFESLEHQKEVIFENYCKKVGPNDEVYLLGDIAFGKLSGLGIESLPGVKNLVPGNHDRVRKGREKDVQDTKDAGLRVWFLRKLIIIQDGVFIGMSHYPYDGDSGAEDRFPERRPVRSIEKLLAHGHVHNEWLIKGNQINVGVDVHNFEPVELDQVIELYRSHGGEA